MLRIALELGALYTLFRWARLFHYATKKQLYWITSQAAMVIITLVAFAVMLPIGYHVEMNELVFEDAVSTGWFIVDVLEVSVFFMLCEYFERQVKRNAT